MKVKSESEVSQSCPHLSDPTDCSLPGSSVHGIFQARVLEWGAIAFSGIKSTTLPKLSGPTPYSSVFIYVLQNIIGVYYIETEDTWQESETL